MSENSIPGSVQDKKTTIMEEADGILASSSAEEAGNQSTTPVLTEIDCHEDLNLNIPVLEIVGKRKITNQSETALCDSTFPPDDSQNSSKKQKRIADDVATVISDYSKNFNLGACDESKHITTCATSDKSVEHASNKLIGSSSTCHGEHDKSIGDGPKDATNETEFKLSNPMEGLVDGLQSLSDWKPLEKELYLKGVEMFGRNRYGAFCVLPHTIMLRNASMP